MSQWQTWCWGVAVGAQCHSLAVGIRAASHPDPPPPEHLRQSPLVLSMAESGPKGVLCQWRLLPALPWQHICFLHFPAPCQGRAPALPVSTQAQEKSKSQQNTFLPVPCSPGHSTLFNDCKNLYYPTKSLPCCCCPVREKAT